MRTIDYRTTGWGHNFYTYPPKIEHSDYTLLAIFGYKISEGDEVLWKTEYGHLAAEVLRSKWKRDPDDMYELQVRIVRRYDHDGNLLWSL